jgi:hypothetical protein
VIRDFQSLSAQRCACTGFVPLRGALSDATFTEPDPDPLTLPLRIARPSG